MPPQTHYAASGDVNIAYQVVGDGPIDLVFVPGFVSHLDLRTRATILVHLSRRSGAHGSEWL
jgi:hypothetical protein